MAAPRCTALRVPTNAQSTPAAYAAKRTASSVHARPPGSFAQHVIGDAVAVARLIGVAAAVHVGEVEIADRAKAVRMGEKRADRRCAANLGDEDALAVAPD